ncbi:MAG: c-type cytochrome [Methylococcales bacterium]|nr:c-type cytochrome [Methylococcales bacterium]
MHKFLFVFVGILFSSTSFSNPLLGLPPLLIPKDNLQTTDKIKLGQLLFNDARFSSTNSISCASCHDSNKAFTDGLKVAKGIKGLTGLRNAPTVVNSAFYKTYFLDGREPSLEAQSLGPFLNPVEHGLEDFKKILNIIRLSSDYPQMFKKVFDVSVEQITIGHVAKAIASFERTLIAGNSPFDQYYFGRDHTKLTESAARGMRLFRRKGNCANCHEISFDNALFMDNRFYNIGIGFNLLKLKLDEMILSFRNGKTVEELDVSPEQHSELGRFNVTHILSDIGKFKTPTLRNISLTAPYMHDGSMDTLEEIVEYYDKGGNQNRFIDPAIFPLHLTKQEKIDLVAFMKSLTSSQFTSNKK